MALWTIIERFLLWPGHRVLKMFPNLQPAESRLVHNVVNYVVWVGLLIGLTLYLVMSFVPAR